MLLAVPRPGRWSSLGVERKNSEGGEKMFRGQRDEENMGELQSMFAVIKITESEKEKDLSKKR